MCKWTLILRTTERFESRRLISLINSGARPQLGVKCHRVGEQFVHVRGQMADALAIRVELSAVIACLLRYVWVLPTTQPAYIPITLITNYFCALAPYRLKITIPAEVTKAAMAQVSAKTRPFSHRR